MTTVPERIKIVQDDVRQYNALMDQLKVTDTQYSFPDPRNPYRIRTGTLAEAKAAVNHYMSERDTTGNGTVGQRAIFGGFVPLELDLEARVTGRNIALAGLIGGALTVAASASIGLNYEDVSGITQVTTVGGIITAVFSGAVYIARRK